MLNDQLKVENSLKFSFLSTRSSYSNHTFHNRLWDQRFVIDCKYLKKKKFNIPLDTKTLFKWI